MIVQGEIEIIDDPTALYRLYGADDALLYVGVTRNISLRLSQHKADKKWWPQVTRRTMTWYGSRAEARAAESKAVFAEKPMHNREEPAPEYPYVALAAVLRKRIISGEIEYRLPAEQQLMRETGMALTTVRKAMALLRDEGLIKTVHAMGSFVLRD